MPAPICECRHSVGIHTLWDGCTNGNCHCQKSQSEAYEFAYNRLNNQFEYAMDFIRFLAQHEVNPSNTKELAIKKLSEDVVDKIDKGQEPKW